jgi:hypothetical protein
MPDIRALLKQAAATGKSEVPTTPKNPAGINVAAEAEALAKKKREQSSAAEKAKHPAGRYGKE